MRVYIHELTLLFLLYNKERALNVALCTCNEGGGCDEVARCEAGCAISRLHCAVLFGEIWGPLDPCVAPRRKSSGSAGVCLGTTAEEEEGNEKRDREGRRRQKKGMM